MTKKSTLSPGEMRLLLAAGLCALLTLSATLWHYANIIPAVTIPSAPKMPNPNARDYYLQAEGAIVPYQLPLPGGGTFPLVYNGSMMLPYNSPTFGKGTGIAANQPKTNFNGFLNPSLAELQGLARVNAPAIAAFRAGLQYDFRETPNRSFRSSPVNSRVYLEYRDLADFLAFDVNTKLLSGDWDGAANEAIDIIHFGGELPRGATVFGMEVGGVVQLGGRDSAATTIDHLNAGQARMAARRLEDILQRQTSFADSLQEEKWFVQASLLDIFHQANWQQKLAANLFAGRKLTPFELLRLYTTSKHQLFTGYTRYLDAQIARARRPFAAAGADPPLPNNDLAREMTYFMPNVRRQYAENAAKNGLLMLRFALRAYDLEHGSYPAALEQLTPSYLKAVPLDPCGAGEPLHYHRSGQGYTLYSVGLNGKDDHGTIDDIVVNQQKLL